MKCFLKPRIATIGTLTFALYQEHLFITLVVLLLFLL